MISLKILMLRFFFSFFFSLKPGGLFFATLLDFFKTLSIHFFQLFNLSRKVTDTLVFLERSL